MPKKYAENYPEKKYFEIGFCLETANSNCTAVSEGGKIQNSLGYNTAHFWGNGNNTSIFLRISDLYLGLFF
jgi:thermostable 8-oxoguanine DNA glycosylase